MQGIWKFKSKLGSNTLISLILYSVSICTSSVQLTDAVDEVYFRGIFFSNGHILTTEAGSSDRPCVWNPKIWSEVERKRYFVSLAATFTFYLAKWMYDFLSLWMVQEMPKSRWALPPSMFDSYSEILHRKDIFKCSLFTVPSLFSMLSLPS